MYMEFHSCCLQYITQIFPHMALDGSTNHREMEQLMLKTGFQCSSPSFSGLDRGPRWAFEGLTAALLRPAGHSLQRWSYQDNWSYLANMPI